jgi:S-adenosylmethionine:tRNA ribosyltransferase-isomerase
MNKLRSSDLDFELSGFDVPQSQRPYYEHRLLVCEKGINEFKHILFNDILNVLREGDLLVFNNSQVVHTSIFLEAGKFLLFIEPQKDELNDVRIICPFKPVVGERFEIGGNIIVLNSHEPGWDIYHASISTNGKYETLGDFLKDYAKIPMPIYLKRIPTKDDEIALQNFYAKYPGSISTPVAGLHFSPELLSHLQGNGIRSTEVTLHVGYGTFRSFKTEYINDHTMDPEWYSVSTNSAREIRSAIRRNSRIIGVGTTSVRVLESIAGRKELSNNDSECEPLVGETTIFIYPPYEFKLTNGLITNFQYPRLPVLAMAAAFTGMERIKELYNESIREKYKFYTFGDAMLLLNK